MLRTSVAIALLAWAPPAAAQDAGGFDAHGFRLAPLDADARDPLTLVRPDAQSAGRGYAGGVLEYASRPLVFERYDDRVEALTNVVAANLSGGYAVIEPLRFGAAVPVFFASTGETGEAQGVGIGDARLDAQLVPVAPGEDGGAGVGLRLNVDLPLGDPEAFLGSSSVAGGLAALATVEASDATLSAEAGLQLRQETPAEERPAPTRGGTAVAVGVAGSWLLGASTGVGVEVGAEVPLTGDVYRAIGIPTQALASVRHVTTDGAFVSGGVGVGLTGGAGASPLRLVIGGGFGSGSEAVVDRDGDGIADGDDTCPDEPETANGMDDDDGCPDTLPTMTITVVDQGEPMSDAELHVTQPDGKDVDAQGSFAASGFRPGTVWRAWAQSGTCLRGELESTLGDADTEVAVELELVEAEVRLNVWGPDGEAVPDVKIRYRTEDKRCLPTDTSIAGTKATHRIGPGTHTVFITAPGYSVYREQFTVDLQEAFTITARLQPVGGPEGP